MVKKSDNILKSIDWWTILIYLTLLTFGWISVCGASYTYGETDLFSFSTRSGMQIIWIGTSLLLGLVLLLLDDRFYDTFAYVLFAILLILLFATIFNPHSIKGSRSWLVLGPLRLQPAEFAKFATALALAKFMSHYEYSIHNWRDCITTLSIIFLPMLFIVMQRETGSALVYLSFFLVLYREGMTGSVLFTGVALVIYFVLGIRFADIPLFNTPTMIGSFIVLLLIQIFTIGMTLVYNQSIRQFKFMLYLCLGVTLTGLIVSLWIYPFNLIWLQIILCIGLIIYLLWEALSTRIITNLWIAIFSMGSLLFFNTANYALNNILEPHQRTRINVLLGLEEDLRGAGYNVHQSEIAIGSGGLEGKGFLNGTQTKLKYVPEQDTDFIFCTVGEEEGFIGAAGVLLLFLALILRLIHLAERQTTTFGRVYGYCVLSVFLFHVFINVGMVLGLTPVIGIPLPFFSYGGSSLWGFTLLLFIFLRIDAGR